ncbi:MAG: hypothetical protein LV481_02255 [Methylacidiphilales bacterium]|nr:hypothetical protein [Candidatus Methylacidiphilales bacterium]
MARFFVLSLRFFLAAAACLISGFPGLMADPSASMMTNAPPANVKPPPATASTKPGAPAPPVPPQDPYNRYGNILQQGVEVAHPLRLGMLPFPDVGEIKVPNQDQLASREKLEALAALSDDQIRDQLSKWPPFTKMSLRDEAMMLSRIQDFRDYRAKVAQKVAHDLGLLTLTPEQEARFEKEYWNKRLPMERDLAKQFEPILKQRQMQLGEALYREFSSPNGPPAQPPKPPAPAKPAAPLASTQTAQAGTNSSQPPAH